MLATAGATKTGWFVLLRAASACGVKGCPRQSPNDAV